jgi:cytochrome P450
MRESKRVFGPFALFTEAVPFIRYERVALLSVPLVLTAGAAFNREVLQDPATWRSVGLFPGGPRNSAARRLNQGLMRLTGHRHAHYRSLITPPLRRLQINELGERMLRVAQERVALWPVGEPIDLAGYADRLIQDIAIELLFGADREYGAPIAEMTSRLLGRNWGLSAAAFPINLPVTPYGQYVRDAAVLERHVLAWAERKRGCNDDRDLAAIVVNSSDVDGTATSEATIAAQIPTLLIAAFEACVSALTWALILLAQHPRIARNVLDELSKTGADGMSAEAIINLALLDATVKETLRLLPPLPLHFRVAQVDTTLAGYPVPRGTRVVLSALLTNRNPKIYQDPDVFRPERWQSINPGVSDFMVFSAGPQSCPGYWFAFSVLKIALATILTRHRLELVPPVRIDYGTRPTLRPVGRVPAVLHPQDGEFAARPIAGTVMSLVQFA